VSPILGIYASQISGHLWAPSGAYDSIATTTVGAGGAASITFSSIPQTYTHLQIRGIGKWDTTANDISGIQWQLNGDTGSNYAYHYVRGSGSAVSATGVASQTNALSSSSMPTNNSSYTNMFGAVVFDLLDYTNTSKNKTIRTLSGVDTNGGTYGYINFSSGLWMNTSAVTSVTVKLDGSMAQYSQFALYGIKGA
jgi:hypothetical protein